MRTHRRIQTTDTKMPFGGSAYFALVDARRRASIRLMLGDCLIEQMLRSLMFGIVFQYDCDKDREFASVHHGTLRWLPSSNWL